MNQAKNIYTSTVRLFLTVSLLVFTLSSVAGAEEKIDHLHPCPYPMMGVIQISEYHYELNKLLLGNRVYTNVAMVTLPSFSEESAVMITKDENKKDIVEYVRPEKSIWVTLARNRNSKKDTSIKFIPLETIIIKSYTRGISKRIVETLEKVWMYMVEGARLESIDDMYQVLDGTRHNFLYRASICGSYPQVNAGATVNEFLELAEALENYAKSEKASDVTEESILKRAQVLLVKLKKK